MAMPMMRVPRAFVPQNSVMIDIETLGGNTSYNPIIQIGAVRFDADFRESAAFDQKLLIPIDRCADDDTRRWWRETDEQLLQEILAAGRPVDRVLPEFNGWLGWSPVLWAWPAVYDLTFIEAYAKRYLPSMLPTIWRSRWVDSRSWIAGIRRDWIGQTELDAMLKASPPFSGREHDALYDARWQVWCLSEVARVVREREAAQPKLFGD
jgi:DNA polymerase III epsilon subunit-like protein